ncbi:DUF937 domain-containing protein [Echinicola shivajiensis]|uniref:DUF937 domain-containing protein n=1 Tax=Echinicola shivajiensis TaxID=1035916 RepID=UPI001BFCB018|nr:DUF937 domain-containing protein [Echinicola shivajiensis]
MIDSIIKGLRPEILSKLTDQLGLSQEQVSSAMDTTKESLSKSVTEEVTGGNLDSLLELVNQGSKASGNSSFNNIASNLAADFISKLGVSDGIAKQITNFILPMILDKIAAQSGGNASKTDLVKLFGESLGNIIKGKSREGILGRLGDLFK